MSFNIICSTEYNVFLQLRLDFMQTQTLLYIII